MVLTVARSYLPLTKQATMNPLKKLRQQSGYTQQDLVEMSGLSLRTIQRLEADAKAPQGHSLKMLAEVFNLKPTELRKKFTPAVQNEDAELLTVKFINLAVLALFVFPFGNIILPVYLWRKHRQSILVNDMGRKIINFQIFWTVVLCFSMIVSPFVNVTLLPSHPLFLYVLFALLAVNFVVVCLTARSIEREEMDFPHYPVALV